MNNKKQKKIGIDARLYGPVGKGLGRYAQEIVDNVLRMDKHNQYVVFLSKENFSQFKIDSPNVKKVLVKPRWYSLAEQIIMPLVLMKEKLDLVHFPHFNVPIFYPGKFVVTIHDLIVTKFPDHRATTLNPILYKIKHWLYGLVIRRAARGAEKIITVSEFTKNDIKNEFKINPEKIIVTYEGVSSLSKEGEKKLDDEKILLRYNIRTPFLLYVGNAYPHKNLEVLIKVFAKARKKIGDLSLVLVGQEDYFYRQIKDYAARQGLYKTESKSNSRISR